MRWKQAAMALVSVAVVIGGASSAYAGDAPATRASTHQAAPSTASSSAGNPMSVRAQASGVCADAHQIGTTALAKHNGVTVASVKQFYSPTCQVNYGYLWVWQSYRDTVDSYDINIAISDTLEQNLFGQVTAVGTTQQEFWSEGADTVDICTFATGGVRGPDGNGAADTDSRC